MDKPLSHFLKITVQNKDKSLKCVSNVWIKQWRISEKKTVWDQIETRMVLATGYFLTTLIYILKLIYHAIKMMSIIGNYRQYRGIIIYTHSPSITLNKSLKKGCSWRSKSTITCKIFRRKVWKRDSLTVFMLDIFSSFAATPLQSKQYKSSKSHFNLFSWTSITRVWIFFFFCFVIITLPRPLQLRFDFYLSCNPQKERYLIYKVTSCNRKGLRFVYLKMQ